MDEFEVLQAIAEFEVKTGLTLAPDQPALVQDNRGGWWHPDVTEEERVKLRAGMRKLVAQ